MKNTEKTILSNYFTLNPIKENLKSVFRQGAPEDILKNVHCSGDFFSIDIKDGIFQTKHNYIHINNSDSDVVFKECVFENIVSINNTFEGDSSIHFHKCIFKDQVLVNEYLASTISFGECIFETNMELHGQISHLVLSNIDNNKLFLDFNVEKARTISILDSNIKTLSVHGPPFKDNSTNFILNRCNINYIDLSAEKNVKMAIGGSSITEIDISSSNLDLVIHDDEIHKKHCLFAKIAITNLSNCSIQNATVQNSLEIKNLTTYKSLLLDSVSFAEYASIQFLNCDFKNTVFRNIQFKKNVPFIEATSFQDAVFFNCIWRKDLPLNANIHSDLIEAYRTLKISYKKDENTYWNQFFFAQEQNAIREYANEYHLSFGDKIILNFNHLTGYGNSFVKSSAILIFEALVFLGLLSLANEYVIDLCNLDVSVPFFFQAFAKTINVTTPFTDPIFTKVNDFIILIHKMFLGALYYQIILSFRKFGRK